MSKAVLISIKPQWCELIASGKKTVEVRKTKPKLDTPFKVYLYQTKQSWVYNIYSKISDWKSKIIGEFLCTGFDEFTPTESGIAFKRFSALHETCLTLREILQYANGEKVYGWHISDLVIYDKPKDLSEFYHKCEKTPCEGCEHLKYQKVNSQERDWDCEYLNYQIPITRPPQSWCYVEE